MADGQCMIIVEQGKIVEVCAEPGEFVYDTSTEPSIFTGNLGESVRETFRTVGKRFTFGGDTEYTEHEFYIAKRERSLIQLIHMLSIRSGFSIQHGWGRSIPLP